MRRIAALLLCAVLASHCLAGDPGALLSAYAELAKQSDPAFSGFSAARGQAFYFAKHKVEDGSELSCASCHHEDPRRETHAHSDRIPCRACHVIFDRWPDGTPKMKRQILAFAPSENPERFTNDWKVERWFEWNCRFLLGRDCTPVEKGDLITWLITVK
jgi:hypothetical protein